VVDRPVALAATMPSVQSPAYAAIDLGTNNCRLLIASPTRYGFRVIDSYSRVVRLGEGLQSSGRLSDAAMDRTIGALRACAARIGRRRLRGLRAVATEACRRAENGRAFLERVHQETGLAIDVISTREEAELALESCGPLLHGDLDGSGAPGRALIFDIGGGSTEVAWVRLGPRARPDLAGYQSLPLGVITLAEQFGARVFTTDGYEAMVAHVMQQLQRFEAVHRIASEVRRRGVRLLGTSGTVTTLASVAMALPRYRRADVDGTVLPGAAALQAIGLLRRLGPEGLRRHGCVGPERASYVLPGCAIFEAIHRLWPTDGVVVADRGLRDGMLLRMMRERSLLEHGLEAELPGVPRSRPSWSRRGPDDRTRPSIAGLASRETALSS